MGWTSFASRGRATVDILRDEISGENEHGKWEWLDHAQRDMSSRALSSGNVLQRLRARLRMAIFDTEAMKRWRLAVAFGRNRVSLLDAQEIVCRCEPIAGWYPLTTLCIDEAVEHALETYEDHPALARYIAMGCARVNRKYDSDGEALDFARQWALEEAVAYAKEDGIAFRLREGSGEGKP